MTRTEPAGYVMPPANPAAPRYVTGHLPAPAEPGTLLGPRDITREYLVVLDDGTSLGYATIDDLRAAAAHDGPARSVLEHQLRYAAFRLTGSPLLGSGR